MFSRVRNVASLRRFRVRQTKELRERIQSSRPEFSSTQWRVRAERSRAQLTSLPRPAIVTSCYHHVDAETTINLEPLGLKNGHNTCYIISALQMLFTAIEFKQYLLTNKTSTQLWNPVPTLPRNAGVSSIYGQGIGRVLSTIVVQLNAQIPTTICPRTNPWKDLLSALSSDYTPPPGELHHQQCASEFVNRILEHLDMELSPCATSRRNEPCFNHRQWFDADNLLWVQGNTNLPRPPSVVPEPLHNFRARIWFESWTQQSSEPVADNFRFQYEISYTCCNCKEVLAREGHVAHMHAINPEHRAKRDRTGNTVIDIVHELSRPVAVDKAYSTPCKRKCCISRRRVVSQIKFVRLPKYFILRINRTCYDSASSRIIKNQSCVRTPISLNLSHAMATPCSAQKNNYELSRMRTPRWTCCYFRTLYS